ncbi:unnamed protein product [Protopolystoma xenopodis]|uniref:Uncharacterized protein n=1 Tax=Protopolystoma xenopodis TaxID=117903 RepID=A0A448X718_9PLAT|nr:unnamed protein product [Protopolystoma xenopodis]
MQRPPMTITTACLFETLNTKGTNRPAKKELNQASRWTGPTQDLNPGLPIHKPVTLRAMPQDLLCMEKPPDDHYNQWLSKEGAKACIQEERSHPGFEPRTPRL